MLIKAFNLIRERRIPWLISVSCEKATNTFSYTANRFTKLFRNQSNNIRISISIVCGFHGKSGGLYAIASIANMLSVNHLVKFVTFPTSNYNPLLDESVELVRNIPDDSALYILDVSCDHETYRRIRKLGKPIIVSCHGLLDSGHGLEQSYVKQSLALADMTHFVSAIQQESFKLDTDKYVIVPNASNKIIKTSRTYNVGVVGNLNDESKNAGESIDIFLKSNADTIHLWSGGKNTSNDKRVLIHQWENNKNKIYNSFDVLIFMGKQETFSLTVIEALSAGIPCLISAIPAHEQYRNCPGVILVDEQIRPYAHELLNDLLARKDSLRESIIAYWELNYSEAAVVKQWDALVATVCSKFHTSKHEITSHI